MIRRGFQQLCLTELCTCVYGCINCVLKSISSFDLRVACTHNCIVSQFDHDQDLRIMADVDGFLHQNQNGIKTSNSSIEITINNQMLAADELSIGNNNDKNPEKRRQNVLRTN